MASEGFSLSLPSANSTEMERILNNIQKETGGVTPNLSLSTASLTVAPPSSSPSAGGSRVKNEGAIHNMPRNNPMMTQVAIGMKAASPVALQVQPRVEIVEQPKSRGMRFRYKCEGRSAGSIPGESTTNENRTYPTIRIHNYSGPAAIVVVSCVTRDDPARPHPHALVGKDCQKGVCTVKLKRTTAATFPNLGIQCSTKKDMIASLNEREQIKVDPFGTGYNKNLQTMDLNVVRLCFQVFLPDANGRFTRIVPPVVSQCIFDKKAVNDLTICRLSRQSAFAKGGDEVFLLCEKVSKDDVQVRFFEETGDGVIWEAFADFSHNDVHRQYAIVFKTPPYRNILIRSPIQVFLQLVRPSNDTCSDPKPFQYVPDDPDPDHIGRKRQRKTLAYPSFVADINTAPTQYDVKLEPEGDRPISQDTRNRVKAKVSRGGRSKRGRGGGVAATTAAVSHMQQNLPQYSSVVDVMDTGSGPVVTDNLTFQNSASPMTAGQMSVLPTSTGVVGLSGKSATSKVDFIHGLPTGAHSVLKREVMSTNVAPTGNVVRLQLAGSVLYQAPDGGNAATETTVNINDLGSINLLPSNRSIQNAQQNTHAFLNVLATEPGLVDKEDIMLNDLTSSDSFAQFMTDMQGDSVNISLPQGDSVNMSLPSLPSFLETVSGLTGDLNQVAHDPNVAAHEMVGEGSNNVS